MSDLTKQGSTRRWRELRAKILDRDHHSCWICQDYADQVDHIQPRARGGSDDPSNLAAICGSCNRRKRDKPAAFFGGKGHPQTPFMSSLPATAQTRPASPFLPPEETDGSR